MIGTVDKNLTRYIGSVWKNCGPSPGQQSALASDQAFQAMLTKDYGTTFGENQTLMNNLTTNLGGIIQAGPGQQGFTAPELATMNSQAINNAAASNQKLQTVIGENAATHGGGGPGIENGVTSAEKAAAATAVDTGLSNTEANITQANYNTGRQNYWNAVSGQEKAPGAFEDPSNQAASTVTSANSVTGGQANQNEQDSTGTELLGLGEGLAKTAATAAMAG